MKIHKYFQKRQKKCERKKTPKCFQLLAVKFHHLQQVGKQNAMAIKLRWNWDAISQEVQSNI